jgi:predicted O-methyltransferase YrrM
MRINFHLIKQFIRHFFVAKRRGHGVHSPFAYRLCEDVFYNTEQFYAFKQLTQLRNNLLKNETEIVVEDFGAGSRVFKSNKRKINQLTSSGISSVKQSELLYRLVNFLNCKTCVELGTSLGLTTHYLASVNSTIQVYTIEGSSELNAFATQLAKTNSVSNITFMNGQFDEVLPKLLSNLTSIDFFYVDGNHTYEATLTYFNMAIKYAHANTVFVFDDIYWSKGMTKAWNELKKHESVTMSIDLFYFGLLFFKKEVKEKTDLTMYI